MIYRRVVKGITVAAFLLCLHFSASAQNAAEPAAKPLPFVSPIFGDNMVLQRDKVNTIWGWSEPGDKVQVEVGGKHASGVAAADRRWEVKIHPPRVGGPYTISIKGHQTVELHNVLVGDVWLCGGQSNMEVSLRVARNADEEIKAANFPEIRFYSVAQHACVPPQSMLPEGTWKVVSPETGSLDVGRCLLLCAQGPTGDSCSDWPGRGCRRRNSRRSVDERGRAPPTERLRRSA